MYAKREEQSREEKREREMGEKRGGREGGSDGRGQGQGWREVGREGLFSLEKRKHWQRTTRTAAPGHIEHVPATPCLAQSRHPCALIAPHAPSCCSTADNYRQKSCAVIR